MFADCLDKLYAVRKDNPLIIGKGSDSCYIASDVPAIIKYTRLVYYYFGNVEVAVLSILGRRRFKSSQRLVKNSLVIIISQSGENADSQVALRLAKSRGVVLERQNNGHQLFTFFTTAPQTKRRNI